MCQCYSYMQKTTGPLSHNISQIFKPRHLELLQAWIIYGHSSVDDDGQGHSVGLGHEPAQGSCWCWQDKYQDAGVTLQAMLKACPNNFSDVGWYLVYNDIFFTLSNAEGCQIIYHALIVFYFQVFTDERGLGHGKIYSAKELPTVLNDFLSNHQ